MLTNNKFLITGGNGFIGSNIVKKLLHLGKKIKILDNNFRGNNNRLNSIKKEIEFIQGDIRDNKTVIKASKNVNCIIHLAYINGTKNFYEKPFEVLDVAVKGMINILDAMDENKISNLVLASSSEVYQKPSYIPTDEKIKLSIPDIFNSRYSYGGGKIISELLSINYAKSKKKNLIIFRPHNVYGPDMGYDHVIPEFFSRIIPQLNNDTIELKIQGSGKETRSFIFVDDFIDGLIILLNKGKFNNIYNIGTEDEISIKKLIDKMSNVINKNIIIKNKNLKEGSILRRCPSIKKIKKLGFSPSIALNDGLRKTFEWYLKNLENKVL